MVTPFSLHPSPFPRSAYDTVTESLPEQLQHLYHRAASSYTSFLRPAISATAAADPSFTGRLLSLADDAHAHLSALRSNGHPVPPTLGLLRADYMLDKSVDGRPPTPKQVEVNTIAASFAALSCAVSEMHKSTHVGLSPSYSPSSMPSNSALDEIVFGLGESLDCFVRRRSSSTTTTVCLLMVVQPGESNAIDQRKVEFGVLQKYGYRTVRLTLGEVQAVMMVGAGLSQPSAGTQYDLQVPDPLYGLGCSSGGGGVGVGVGGGTLTAGVVYYRAGYTPTDYMSDVPGLWSARLFVENSTAIKCPDAFYHLAGSKKVQQVLAKEEVVRSLIGKRRRKGGGEGSSLDGATTTTATTSTTDAIVRNVMSTFCEMHGFTGTSLDESLLSALRSSPSRWVLKPQREGGGNNFYGPEAVSKLEAIEPEERIAYVLMGMIRPTAFDATCVRDGNVAYRGRAVCELGVFRASLYESNWTVRASAGRVKDDDGENEEEEEEEDVDVLAKFRDAKGRGVGHRGGFILRAKGEDVNEGGVASGYAFLSSPVLTDE